MNKNFILKEFELDGLEHEGFTLVDIREKNELEQYALPEEYSVQHYPLSRYALWKEQLSSKRKYLFICRRGIRSGNLVKELRKHGQQNSFSLRGGIEGLKNSDASFAPFIPF